MATSEPVKRCTNCQQLTARQKCGACKAIYYCSKKCQAEHWLGTHKHDCKQMVDMEFFNSIVIMEDGNVENKNLSYNMIEDLTSHHKLGYTTATCSGTIYNIVVNGCSKALNKFMQAKGLKYYGNLVIFREDACGIMNKQDEIYRRSCAKIVHSLDDIIRSLREKKYPNRIEGYAIGI
mmetsp:Transcript_12380/g.16077  ORF Transcript_12380/g.16077 Transcript_12380/m.16077 type:complete len:178 (-) Transcript_12380:109-642(-)|eukprot:CAMPEP_0204865234 /NCGR_PEP_ID=MMETSP1348-20121228/6402_1 /ASSEMBLY_ACC=CAM_ASM_000700 /TAXON_ID=215587 /ORGANISM="Aplanochytrium stocchinoi, Strain GSBS06" /LENGTH=177 /DNA_ID=CAMNT_0052016269 /DNA_START=44 /DNA_END=577 /DNA_ORIENTATION=+